MRCHDELGPAAAAGPHADGVAFSVDAHILQPQRGQPRAEVFGARLLLERRRRYHDQRLLVRECVRVVGLQKIEALPDLRMSVDRRKRRPRVRRDDGFRGECAAPTNHHCSSEQARGARQNHLVPLSMDDAVSPL